MSEGYSTDALREASEPGLPSLAEREREALEVAEWDWMQAPGRDGKLHHLAEIDDLDRLWMERNSPGRTSCGRRGVYVVPGMFSRMGQSRCVQCCDRLGIARGVGSPKNDPALRPWVESRLATSPAPATPI